MHTARQRGFTLIELSVVLVIIGLIVGGVLAGQELIKAAQLRAVISEVEKYKAAAMAFEGKYNCLPGDCSHISTVLATTVSGGFPADQNGDVIWNGNGDGIIEGVVYNNCTLGNFIGNNGNPVSREPTDFWHQLAVAGLIRPTGTLTGNYVCGPESCTDSQIGANIPSSAFGEATGYAVGGVFPNVDYGGEFYPGVNGNVFMLGIQSTANILNAEVCQYAGPWLPALSAMDARNLDMKMDDGMPTTGSVTSFTPNGWSYPAPTPACASGASYNVTVTAVRQCTMVFEAGF